MKAAAMLLTLALVQEPTTMLRRTLLADAVDIYKIEDRIDQTVVSAMGTMPMTIVSDRTYTLRTTSVDEGAGTARIEATTAVDKITADGAASAMAAQKPPPVTQKGNIDVRGRITFDAPASEETMAALIGGTQGAISAGNFVEFPEKAVKIGDRWEIVVPKSPFLYDRDQRLACLLTGEKVVDGVPMWSVSLSGTLKTSVDGSKLPIGKSESPLAVGIAGEDVLTGEGLVEKSTGRTMRMTIHGDSKRTITLLETGITLQVQGKVDSKIELQKG